MADLNIPSAPAPPEGGAPLSERLSRAFPLFIRRRSDALCALSDSGRSPTSSSAAHKRAEGWAGLVFLL
jgi:hypothetical protein